MHWDNLGDCSLNSVNFYPCSPLAVFQFTEPLIKRSLMALERQGKQSMKNCKITNLLSLVWQHYLSAPTTGNRTRVNLPHPPLNSSLRKKLYYRKAFPLFWHGCYITCWFWEYHFGNMRKEECDLWRKRNSKGRGVILNGVFWWKEALSCMTTCIIKSLLKDGLSWQVMCAFYLLPVKASKHAT